mmetsp:Transcript_30627/g.47990  ORF Transcript_30627/g.47990 Transcript_30627/m.47990 type:complete len:105 (+) Transcript_30627:814-1128(+)
MSSYPPKRQIFHHRAASESTSSVAGSISVQATTISRDGANSENSDGTDRASNHGHGNAASRPNNNNNNNNNHQSYAMAMAMNNLIIYQYQGYQFQQQLWQLKRG